MILLPAAILDGNGETRQITKASGGVLVIHEVRCQVRAGAGTKEWKMKDFPIDLIARAVVAQRRRSNRRLIMTGHMTCRETLTKVITVFQGPAF